MAMCWDVGISDEEYVSPPVANRSSSLAIGYFLSLDEADVVVQVHFIEVGPTMQPVIVQAGRFAESLRSPCALIFCIWFFLARGLRIGTFRIGSFIL